MLKIFKRMFAWHDQHRKLEEDMKLRLKNADRCLEMDLHQQNRRAIKRVFDDVVVSAVNYVKTFIACPHKVGDEMILNIYNLKWDGRNNWDGGPQGLYSLINDDERQKTVITGKCTKVNVTTSLIDERIDNYIDNIIYSRIEEELKNPEDAKRRLIYWLHDKAKTNIQIPLLYMGVYYDVFFETNTSFQPQWGLNPGCWLPMNSPEGITTRKIWMAQIDVDRRLKELSIKKSEIEKEIETEIEKFKTERSH